MSSAVAWCALQCSVSFQKRAAQKVLRQRGSKGSYGNWQLELVSIYRFEVASRGPLTGLATPNSSTSAVIRNIYRGTPSRHNSPQHVFDP